jgi:predicted O-linked N-acetylglucosamine transferase (SPINDLY family)
MATLSEAFALAVAQQRAGRLDLAEEICRRIVTAAPEHLDAWHLLGLMTQQTGRHREAVASYRRTVELRPQDPIGHNSLGNALMASGSADEAAACYRRALELNPRYAIACNGLGSALMYQGRPQEAVAAFRRALELAPDYMQAHHNLGAAWQALNELDQAAACFQRALAVRESAEGHYNLGSVRKDQGRLSEAVASFRRALELRPTHAALHSNLLYTLLFCPDVDAQTLAEEHRRWNRQHAEPLAAAIPPYANDHTPERRLRVGYVSPHLRAHVVGRNLLPLFAGHDHQQFEIFCYADVPEPDAVTRQLQAGADVWQSSTGMSDAELAEQIRADRIDLLVDLTLHMENNRLLTFARRPAPVQLTWAGYPGTTGLMAIDYRLTDPHLDPPGLDDACYTEESIRLPDSFWCYVPAADDPEPNRLPALETNIVTFGCLGNFCKLNEPVLRLWARMLRAVARSRLLLLAAPGSHRQRVLELFGSEGVAAERIAFEPLRPRAEYLATYHRIDLGLDPFPYNGHSTSLDSLWMGVPIVTLPGRTVVGRAGVSQLHTLQLPELIARNTDHYVQLGAALAHDLPRLAELRATLRQRMQHSPLMDAPRFARNVEAAYRQMWRRWCEKSATELP